MKQFKLKLCIQNKSEIEFGLYIYNQLFTRQSKGSKDRLVPLSLNLKKMIHNYITLRRPLTEHNYVLCCTGTHEQITENRIKYLFAQIKKRADIPRIKPHLLRHTFATSYVLCGGDLESLRIYLGHTTYDTTRIYLHLANTYSRVNQDVYKLNKVF